MVVEHTPSRPITHTTTRHERAYLARPPAWMDQGVCAQAPSEYRDHWFYAPGSAHVQDAQTACFSCPVRARCAAFAIEAEVPYGVWGGMSETELRRLVGLVKAHRLLEAKLALAERRRTLRCHNGHELNADNRTGNGNCLTCFQLSNLTRHGRYDRRQRERRESESA